MNVDELNKLRDALMDLLETTHEIHGEVSRRDVDGAPLDIFLLGMISSSAVRHKAYVLEMINQRRKLVMKSS